MQVRSITLWTICCFVCKFAIAQVIVNEEALSFKSVYSIQSSTTKHEFFRQYMDTVLVYNVNKKCHSGPNGKQCFEIEERLTIDQDALIFFNQARKVLTNEQLVYQKLNNVYRECKLSSYLLNLDFPVEVLTIGEEVLFIKNNYAMNHDTSVICQVFNPNPVVATNSLYGSPLLDNNDANDVSLSSAMSLKYTNITYLTATNRFELSNDWIQIVDVSAPLIPAPVFSSIPLLYTRDEAEFEAVNAYYHMNTFINYFFDSLGYINPLQQQVQVDVHALNGQDNSLFRTAGSPQILFGDGGVDDAEDGQVVIHELTHALLYFSTGGSNSGLERKAVEEGVADYYAASYSKSINEFNSENIPSWDGHNEFWDGRIVNSTKVYPADYFNNIYLDAEIWSSTLMQIEEQLGRNFTNQLLYESTFFYHQGMTMPKAGNYLLKADSLLNGGENTVVLAEKLCAKGLLSNCNQFVEAYDEVLTVDAGQLGQRIIRFSASIAEFDFFRMYNTAGNVCLKDEGELKLSYDVGTLAAGVYFLALRNSDSQKVVKIILL